MLEDTLRKALDVPSFYVFILKGDDDGRIEVNEVDRVDFHYIRQCLEKGDSVFISRKRQTLPLKPSIKSDARSIADEIAGEEAKLKPWFIRHV
jgi:hypothetical protein